MRKRRTPKEYESVIFQLLEKNKKQRQLLKESISGDVSVVLKIFKRLIALNPGKSDVIFSDLFMITLGQSELIPPTMTRFTEKGFMEMGGDLSDISRLGYVAENLGFDKDRILYFYSKIARMLNLTSTYRDVVRGTPFIKQPEY